jgi:hypothetical protein
LSNILKLHVVGKPAVDFMVVDIDGHQIFQMDMISRAIWVGIENHGVACPAQQRHPGAGRSDHVQNLHCNIIEKAVKFTRHTFEKQAKTPCKPPEGLQCLEIISQKLTKNLTYNN